MTRKQFIADLRAAQQGVLPPGIHDVRQGEDDGQFEFLFATAGFDGSIIPVHVTALVPDLDEYPKSHEYMVFGADDAPTHVSDALQNIRRTNGKTVSELLEIVAYALGRVSPDRDGDMQMVDSQLDEDDHEDEDDDDAGVYDSDHEAFDIDSNPKSTPYTQLPPGANLPSKGKAMRHRIRSDLIAAKHEGFKVGALGHLLEGYNCFVVVSIRMSKLGISEEAMHAWQVEPSDYLILMLQYLNGYKTNEELQGLESSRLAANLAMRVCKSKKIKPTLQEAIEAFTVAKKEHGERTSTSEIPNTEDDADPDALRETFISKPLVDLLQERLVPILRSRGQGMSWQDAEQLYNSEVNIGSRRNFNPPHVFAQPEKTNYSLPNIVNADHYASQNAAYSFPLLAMQFLLRHFVRCTEFCLVCHRKMDSELEAIKPYVCEQDLCLYQYMTLGFGPSIEHEILAQPLVVDLLISFCYSSASNGRLKEFPDGLSLTVPPISPASFPSLNPRTSSYNQNDEQKSQLEGLKSPVQAHKFEVGFDQNRLEMLFPDSSVPCPVRRGDWIVLSADGALDDVELHCRVSNTTFYPTVSIGEPNVMTKLPRSVAYDGYASSKPNLAPLQSEKLLRSPTLPPKWDRATFQIYSEDFKTLPAIAKCASICRLLDMLPSVKQMQEYLLKHQFRDLKSWVDRLSPAALGVLRWIIASNRACIMQVDSDTSGASSSSKKQERLYGMKDYMQFRFAMGAPDKEQRFVTAVRNTSQRLSLKYPTIFAWHGSPLYNWHMIIREGLHFKNADHGRAFGDGVYHAMDAQTSSGYSTKFGLYQNQQHTLWANSVLRISSAIALNEIVNAPNEFQSQAPYYVVKQLDWIQTRYLFVQCSPTSREIQLSKDVKPINSLMQDPHRIPKGTSDYIVIPAASSKTNKLAKLARSLKGRKIESPRKKFKSRGGAANPIVVEDDDADDDASVLTTTSDLDLLFSEETELEVEPAAVEGKKPVFKAKEPATDFVPGSLDFTKLPLMPLPIYATTGTTKRLMKELQALQKVQISTPPVELGWFIDIDKIDNAYQWIAELHSFHTFEAHGKKLPLADDMLKRGITSVVLEIRFNKDFPYTPPYVRVIRPRFLSLMQGGGGHVVLGGAMCMELLTNSGWSSVSSMESVLMQVRLAIASEPFARLDPRADGRDYGASEAADGYIRACKTHGWLVPSGFMEMAHAG